MELQPPDRGYFGKFLSPSRQGIFRKIFGEIWVCPNALDRVDSAWTGPLVYLSIYFVGADSGAAAQDAFWKRVFLLCRGPAPCGCLALPLSGFSLSSRRIFSQQKKKEQPRNHDVDPPLMLVGLESGSAGEREPKPRRTLSSTCIRLGGLW